MKEATDILGNLIAYVQIGDIYVIAEDGNIYELDNGYSEENISRLRVEKGFVNVLLDEKEPVILKLHGYFKEVNDTDIEHTIGWDCLGDFEAASFKENDFGVGSILKPLEDTNIYLVQVARDGFHTYHRFFDSLDDAQKYLEDELVVETKIVS